MWSSITACEAGKKKRVYIVIIKNRRKKVRYKDLGTNPDQGSAVLAHTTSKTKQAYKDTSNLMLQTHLLLFTQLTIVW